MKPFSALKLHRRLKSLWLCQILIFRICCYLDNWRKSKCQYSLPLNQTQLSTETSEIRLLKNRPTKISLAPVNRAHSDKKKTRRSIRESRDAADRGDGSSDSCALSPALTGLFALAHRSLSPLPRARAIPKRAKALVRAGLLMGRAPAHAKR